jgi:hypothetical protein
MPPIVFLHLRQHLVDSGMKCLVSKKDTQVLSTLLVDSLVIVSPYFSPPIIFVSRWWFNLRSKLK